MRSWEGIAQCTGQMAEAGFTNHDVFEAAAASHLRLTAAIAGWPQDGGWRFGTSCRRWAWVQLEAGVRVFAESRVVAEISIPLH